MGSGLAEVLLLIVLTVIVLPGFLFALLALLDRFERSLDPDAQTPPVLVVKPAPAVGATAAQLDRRGSNSRGSEDTEREGADVVELPIAVTVTESPAAATG